MLTKEEFESISDAAEKLGKFLSGCASKETGLKDNIKSCDQEIQDLEHELEFCNLSRSERSRIATRIKEVRIKRRYAKNMLECLDHCLKVVRDNPKTVPTISTMGSKIKESITTQENRVYTPRVNSTSKVTGQHYEVKKENNKYKVGKRSK